MNLLSNAIKYAPENGRVELILENLSYENNVAKDKIIIRDNGLGMSDSFMERMYEPFSQEHCTNHFHRNIPELLRCMAVQDLALQFVRTSLP